MYKAAQEMRTKIQNLVNEVHKQVACYLTTNRPNSHLAWPLTGGYPVSSIRLIQWRVQQFGNPKRRSSPCQMAAH